MQQNPTESYHTEHCDSQVGHMLLIIMMASIPDSLPGKRVM